jgi:biotin carboxyl carrier protein
MAGLAAPLRVVLAHGGANGSTPPMVVEPGADGSSLVDGQREEAELVLLDPPRARLTTGDGRHDLTLLQVVDGRLAGTAVQRLEVVVDGWRFEIDVEPESRARLRERATRAAGDRARGGPAELRAIIPGRVVAVDVVDGDAVEAGQRVLVIEAMKMQNEVRSPRVGTIGRVAVGAGQRVELGDVLLVIE